MPISKSEIFEKVAQFSDQSWVKRREVSESIVAGALDQADAAREVAFAVSDKLELSRESSTPADFKNILYWSVKTLGSLTASEECRTVLVSIVKDRQLKEKYRQIAMSELMKYPYSDRFRDELMTLLCDPDWKIRQLAAKQLETFPAELVSQYLMKDFYNITNDDVIYWVLQIIGQQMGDNALKFFEGILYSSPTSTKLYVILALSSIKTESSFKLIVDCFDDPSYMIRTQVHQIVEKNIKICAKYVYNFAFSTDFRTRCEALKYLIKSTEPQYQSMVTKMVTQGTAETKILGLISLGEAGEMLAIDFVYDRFADDSWYIRNFASTIMVKYGPVAWNYLVGKYNQEHNSNNRYWILICLGNIAVPDVQKHMDDLADMFKKSKKVEKLQILGIVNSMAEAASDEKNRMRAFRFLIEALNDSKWLVRKETSTLLQKISPETIRETLKTFDSLTADQVFWLKQILPEM